MDEFGYLSVLIAIILGLAITQILQGFRGLLHARERVKIYWPSLVASGVVLVIVVQSWWAMFGLRAHTDWTFLQFAVVLMQVIAEYMIAALVLPDFLGEGRFDLRKTYFQQARWYFGFLILTLVMSLSKDLVIGGSLPSGANVAFHAFFIVTSAYMAFTRSDFAHKAFAVLSSMLITLYIVVLFAHLQ